MWAWTKKKSEATTFALISDRAKVISLVPSRLRPWNWMSTAPCPGEPRQRRHADNEGADLGEIRVTPNGWNKQKESTECETGSFHEKKLPRPRKRTCRKSVLILLVKKCVSYVKTLASLALALHAGCA